jgi:hypothetical protein
VSINFYKYGLWLNGEFLLIICSALHSLEIALSYQLANESLFLQLKEKRLREKVGWLLCQIGRWGGGGREPYPVRGPWSWIS